MAQVESIDKKTKENGSAPSESGPSIVYNSRKYIIDDLFATVNHVDPVNYMPKTHFSLQYFFTKAIRENKYFKVGPLVATIAVPKNEKYGDYQCNDAMRIMTMLKAKGITSTPFEIAEAIVKCLPENNVIDKAEAAKSGFISITIKKSYALEIVKNTIVYGVKPPAVTKKTVIVDFSSPNIAKEMHVGHLRSTILGETICRTLEFVGMDVKRINHVGDWGTQFGMLIANLKDEFPDYRNNMPDISDLQKFYKASKKRFDSDPDFKKRAHDIVVSLQGGDPDIRAAWNVICDVSRKEFQKVYDRLDVTLEEKGESFYQDRMTVVVKDLEESKLSTIEDGCVVVHTEADDVPLLVVKSDGAYTYDTSDLATLKYRLFEQNGDWCIYVVDVGQRSHFLKFFEVGYKLGWYDPSINRIEHIGFGVVLGDDNKKFKTRSGETIRLVDLLDEAVKRAEDATRQKSTSEALTDEEIRIVSEAKGYGCVRYNDMAHNLTNDYKFSFDRMLDERGNTAVYLLYANTRIRSILRNSGVSEDSIWEFAKNNGISISDPAEFKLVNKIISFPDVVYQLVFESYPHTLCEYIYNLSSCFTAFYDKCMCIEKDAETGQIRSVNMSRISLIYSVSLIFMKGFHLLALRPVEKM